MKFVIVIVAVFFLAVILSVQSSFVAAPALGLGLHGLGLGLNPLGLTSVGLGLNGLGLGIGGINGLGFNSLGLLKPLLGLGHRADLASLRVPVGVSGQSFSNHGQGFLTAPTASVNLDGLGIIGHGATYIAQNRGAIHTAPLDGHIDSAASINVAPAPGTL